MTTPANNLTRSVNVEKQRRRALMTPFDKRVRRAYFRDRMGFNRRNFTSAVKSLIKEASYVR